MSRYAIISVGGKQHRVQEGERLLVDNLGLADGKTFHPTVLLVGGDGDVQISPKDVQVTAKVVQHLRGEKVRIGKHRQRTGYRRQNGFRSALTQIEIESIGKKAAARPKAEPKPKAEAEAPKQKPKPKAAPKPKTEKADGA